MALRSHLRVPAIGPGTMPRRTHSSKARSEQQPLSVTVIKHSGPPARRGPVRRCEAIFGGFSSPLRAARHSDAAILKYRLVAVLPKSLLVSVCLRAVVYRARKRTHHGCALLGSGP